MQKYKGRKGYYEMPMPLQRLMPCGPEHFDINPFILAETFDTSAQEEAMARFVIACQDVGGWCGISLEVLFNDIFDEDCQFMELSEYNKMISRQTEEINKKRMSVYRRQKRNFWLKVFFTFGVYKFFNRGPEEPDLLRNEKIKGRPDLVVRVSNKMHILAAFRELLAAGVLVSQKIDRHTIMFPTPELVNRLKKFKVVRKAEILVEY